MFRISLIVVLLALDVTAKYLDGLTEQALQEALQEAEQESIVSLDEKGKMLWVEEVEPPEDMDVIQYVIDPRMKIWKGMTDVGKQPPVPENDLDELNHPSLINLRDQDEGFHSVSDHKGEPLQGEPLQGERAIQYSKEAEQDKDDIHHPDVSGVAFREPEQDLDEVYHKVWEQVAPLVSKSRKNVKDRDAGSETDELYGRAQSGDLKLVRLHLQPEEDLDDLHHRDVAELQQNHPFPKAAVPIENPSQRRYSVPEEDLDDIHHQ